MNHPIPQEVSVSTVLKKNARRLVRTWPALLLLATVGLQGGPVVYPDHVEVRPNPAAFAYKKQISRDPATWQWSIPLVLPLVTHGVVHSPSMNRDVGYNVYLPPGYAEDTTTRYPVVYYCHGATGSETSDVSLAAWVASQIEKGNIGKVIYVFMNAGHFSGYRDRPEENVMTETFITRELIPEMDRRYRTLARREGRALMGFSMGGGGAVRLALKHPDLFCAAVSFGGSLGRNPTANDHPSDRGNDPDNIYHWATVNQARIKDRVGLFFIVGQEDRMYPLHPPLLQHLHGLKIGFHHRVIAGLGHDFLGAVGQCGGEAIRFLASQYDEAGIGPKQAP